MDTTESIDERIKAAQLRKLQVEIDNLERGHSWSSRVAQYIPVITALIAVSGFLFGIIQYRRQEAKHIEANKLQSERDNALRAKEFKKLFWEKQLEEYRAITQSAARLATWDAGDARDKEYLHFRELYHGNLVMVSDKQVVDATKEFLQLYIDYRTDPSLQGKVDRSSRRLSIACRESLRQTWDVPLQALDLSQIP
jgi:hypothetical protein